MLINGSYSMINENNYAKIYFYTCVYQNVLKFMFKQFVFN